MLQKTLELGGECCIDSRRRTCDHDSSCSVHLANAKRYTCVSGLDFSEKDIARHSPLTGEYAQSPCADIL